MRQTVSCNITQFKAPFFMHALIAMYSERTRESIAPLVSLSSLAVFLMHIYHLLYLIEAPHKDARPVMDMFRHHREHTLHSAVDRLSTG